MRKLSEIEYGFGKGSLEGVVADVEVREASAEETDLGSDGAG